MGQGDIQAKGVTMQDQPQEQQHPPFHELRQNFGLFIGICQIIGKPLEAWLRQPGTWGERYVTHQTLLGWLFIPVFSGLLYPREPQGPVICFWWLTACLLIAHRLRGWRLRRKGYRPHSRYMGRSWLPCRSEVNAKCNWEPTLVWIAGPLLMGISIPLGVYMLVAGSALFFAAGWQNAADKARLRQIRDARLDQEWLMERIQED